MWKKVQLLIQSDTHFWNFTKWVSNYKSGYHFDKVGIKITAQLCYTSIFVLPWKVYLELSSKKRLLLNDKIIFILHFMPYFATDIRRYINESYKWGKYFKLLNIDILLRI